MKRAQQMTLANTEKMRLPLFGKKTVSQYKGLFILTVVLLACLRISHIVFLNKPAWWLIVPVVITLGLIGERYTDAERPAVRLLQLVGCLSALYSLLYYPLMPVAPEIPHASASYAFLVAVWLFSLVCGVACFRIPSLAAIPSAFLIWGKLFAVHVTGLPNVNILDVSPLAEIGVCIGLGLLVIRAFRDLVKQQLAPPMWTANGKSIPPEDNFARLLVLLAISIHLANYFWSFVQKTLVGDGILAWVTENNPAYIFLATLHDKHVVFSDIDGLVNVVFQGLDHTYIFSNLIVFVAQAAAITAFFIPRILFLCLLLIYDVMHFAIIVAVGANFWPWIILNVLIGFVVARYDFNELTIVHRVVGAAFILCAPLFVSTARLGWFDTGANNYVSIEAVDSSGQRYLVSTNFYTFYSYPIAHFDYGMPDSAHGFVTGTPNGAGDYKAFRAGRTCDVPSLLQESSGEVDQRELDPRLLTFIRNYHSLAIAIQDHIGTFPYDYYPHHLYVPTSAAANFYRLDKRLVTAYVVKRESACLSFADSHLIKKVISVAEQRINVP
jgi:hypothetical protein